MQDNQQKKQPMTFEGLMTEITRLYAQSPSPSGYEGGYQRARHELQRNARGETTLAQKKQRVLAWLAEQEEICAEIAKNTRSPVPTLLYYEQAREAYVHVATLLTVLPTPPE